MRPFPPLLATARASNRASLMLLVAGAVAASRDDPRLSFATLEAACGAVPELAGIGRREIGRILRSAGWQRRQRRYYPSPWDWRSVRIRGYSPPQCDENAPNSPADARAMMNDQPTESDLTAL